MGKKWSSNGTFSAVVYNCSHRSRSSQCSRHNGLSVQRDSPSPPLRFVFARFPKSEKEKGPSSSSSSSNSAYLAINESKQKRSLRTASNRPLDGLLPSNFCSFFSRSILLEQSYAHQRADLVCVFCFGSRSVPNTMYTIKREKGEALSFVRGSAPPSFVRVCFCYLLCSLHLYDLPSTPISSCKHSCSISSLLPSSLPSGHV